MVKFDVELLMEYVGWFLGFFIIGVLMFCCHIPYLLSKGVAKCLYFCGESFA